jgi:hypothetical protein
MTRDRSSAYGRIKNALKVRREETRRDMKCNVSKHIYLFPIRSDNTNIIEFYGMFFEFS